MKKKEYIEKCYKYEKRVSRLHITLNKQYEKVKRQAAEITLLLQQKEDLKEELEVSNQILENTQKKLYEQNENYLKAYDDMTKMYDKQLEAQDKAIARKDEQFEALKRLYKDDLINGRI